jgi:hypothetical protein
MLIEIRDEEQEKYNQNNKVYKLWHLYFQFV